MGCATPHLQALILAALETCCREGELLTLRWSDVALQRGENLAEALRAQAGACARAQHALASGTTGTQTTSIRADS